MTFDMQIHAKFLVSYYDGNYNRLKILSVPTSEGYLSGLPDEIQVAEQEMLSHISAWVEANTDGAGTINIIVGFGLLEPRELSELSVFNAQSEEDLNGFEDFSAIEEATVVIGSTET